MGSLVLGIGGVGKCCMMKLRKILVEERGTLTSDIQFLHIDTFNQPIPGVGEDFPTQVLGQDISLSSQERLDLSLGLPTPPNTQQLAQHPHVRDWFPPSLPVNVNFASGAGGVRAYGRLALHHQIARFRGILAPKLGAVGAAANVDVYLVASVFGGTGSGCFLDVCYNVKELLTAAGINGEVKGFLVIGAFQPNAVMQGNCYAAMKELEYYMTEGNQPFEVRYPVEGVANLVASHPPLDFCYLFAPNNGEVVLSRSELEDLVARRIHFDLVDGINMPMKGQRIDTVATPSYYQPDTLLGRSKKFFSTGCSILEFPATRLMNALGAAYAACTCRHLRYETARGLPDLKKAVEDFIQKNLQKSFEEEDLARELQKQDSRTVGTAMQRDRNQWKADFLQKLKDRKEELDVKDILTQVDSVVDQTVQMWSETGTYTEIVSNNMENIWKEALPVISDKVTSLVSAPDIGPVHTTKLLDSLITKLDTMLVRLKKALELADSGLRQCSGELTQRRDRIRRDWKFQWELGKHLQWLCDGELAAFMGKAHKKASLSAIMTLIDRLKRELTKKRRQIEEYVTWLKESELGFTQESQSVCRNLLTWIAAETPAHQAHLVALVQFLTTMSKDGLAQLEPSLENVILTYNLNNPFDGTTFSGKMDQVITTLRSPFVRHSQDRDALTKDLLKECRRVFEVLKMVNICELLCTTLDDAERNELFRDKERQAAWYLNVFTNDPTINHDPVLHERKWVGVPNSIPINNHQIWNGLLGGYNAGNQRFTTLLEPYRMVFASETSVFCLRNVQPVQSYSRSFSMLSPDEQRLRHTHYQIDFPDIMPPNPLLHQIRQRSDRASVLGKAFAILKESQDPETQSNAIYLNYTDPKNKMPLRLRLCDDWRDLEEALDVPQARKEIDKAVSGTTPLEILEDEIGRYGQSKTNREEKRSAYDQIMQFLSQELDGLRRQHPDSQDIENHPVHQKHLRITSEFMNEYRIQSQ